MSNEIPRPDPELLKQFIEYLKEGEKKKFNFEFDDNEDSENEIQTEENDAYEYYDLGGEERKLELNLQIEYLDRRNNITGRRIILRRYIANTELTDAFLSAYCYLRDAGRYFFARRIQKCIDLDTGEIITDVPRYLEHKYWNSTEGIIEKIWNTLSNELRILIYAGKLDGALRKGKKQAIANYVLNITQEKRITEDDFIDSLQHTEAVTRYKFARLVGEMTAKPIEERQSIVDAVYLLLQSKKKMNAAEEEVIDYLKKKLKISSIKASC